MSDSEDFLPGLGHNGGPPQSDWIEELHPAVLRDQWDVDYPDLKRRRDELIEGYKRFEETVKEITDDVMDAKASDFAAQFVKLEKRVEAARKIEKAPFDAAAAAAQRYFKADILDALAVRRGKILALMTAYKVRKDAAAKRAREEEAKRVAELAEKVNAQAELSGRVEDINDAAEATLAADVAMRQALAPNAAATRSRGVASTSFLRTSYHYEVEDISLVPEEYVLRVANDEKLTAALRAAELLANGGEPSLNIPGVRVVAVHNTGIRT